MEFENANLKEAHMTIAKKMGKQNESWKEALKIANGGKIERANATWKGAHLTNEEYMEGTNASWKEATWCGEYRQMKCNQGKGKVPNAAQMETTN